MKGGGGWSGQAAALAPFPAPFPAFPPTGARAHKHTHTHTVEPLVKPHTFSSLPCARCYVLCCV
eukprot:370751-Pelagomonas_calceolata.AAC.1